MSNLLKYEESPYLLQHKENPINWYPWCDAAFDRAKKENKTIFISIGYSTCHWCHVMEREVFENEEMAAFLNEHFVCIKVDKEERPEIDKYFQNVYQTLNNKAGGWPTSIFSTPENKPFFAATYIPLEPKYNIVGFRDLTQIIYEKISTHDETLFKNADELQGVLSQSSSLQKSHELDISIKEKFIKQCKNNFEPTYGGFTLSTKFPQVSTLNTMLTIYELDREDEIRSMIVHTLDNMIAGGFYDLVDGGFCRYSVDAEWLVPHFEKMMYDNGLLCELYLRAFRVLKNSRYLEIAQDISDYIQKFMMQDFFLYSASDADTDGVEGAYFVYTKAEVLLAIRNEGYSESEVKRMAMRLLVSNSGNFDGKNIIHFANIQKEEWFESIRGSLQKIRETRVYPFVDKKVQTSWSSMMIKSLFLLGVYDKKVLKVAKSSLETLLEKMFENATLMHSCIIDKKPKIEAYLEDYAYLSLALLKAYEVCAEERYLQEANSLTDRVLTLFYKDGEWKFSRGEFEILAEVEDDSYPSSIGVMIDVLLSLGSLVDDKYREYAYETLNHYSSKINGEPIASAYTTEQLIRYLYEDKIVKLPRSVSYKNICDEMSSPFVFVKYHSGTDYELCSNSGCYAKGKDLKELLSKTFF